MRLESVGSLVSTSNFEVVGNYEEVVLKTSMISDLVIGDFYGCPEGAIIDWNEKWVIMFGYGLIIYKLEEPFTPFSYNIESSQWIELFRNPDVEKPKEIIELEQIEEHKVRFCTDLLDEPMIYDLDLKTLELSEVLKRI